MGNLPACCTLMFVVALLVCADGLVAQVLDIAARYEDNYVRRRAVACLGLLLLVSEYFGHTCMFVVFPYYVAQKYIDCSTVVLEPYSCASMNLTEESSEYSSWLVKYLQGDL